MILKVFSDKKAQEMDDGNKTYFMKFERYVHEFERWTDTEQCERKGGRPVRHSCGHASNSRLTLESGATSDWFYNFPKIPNQRWEAEFDPVSQTSTFSILYTTISGIFLSYVHTIETLWTKSRKDFPKVCAVIPVFTWLIMSSPSLWRQALSAALPVCLSKTLWTCLLPVWSEKTLYKVSLFDSIPPLLSLIHFLFSHFSDL